MMPKGRVRRTMPRWVLWIQVPPKTPTSAWGSKDVSRGQLQNAKRVSSCYLTEKRKMSPSPQLSTPIACTWIAAPPSTNSLTEDSHLKSSLAIRSCMDTVMLAELLAIPRQNTASIFLARISRAGSLKPELLTSLAFPS